MFARDLNTSAISCTKSYVNQVSDIPIYCQGKSNITEKESTSFRKNIFPYFQQQIGSRLKKYNYYEKFVSHPLREKCSNTDFFLVCIFPHSDRIRRDTECWKIQTRKNSVFGHFSRSDLKSGLTLFQCYFTRRDVSLAKKVLRPMNRNYSMLYST